MPADKPAIPGVEPLNVRTKALYGFGSLAFGAKAGLLGILLFYYNQIVGLPAHLVSLAVGISLFIDAFWDPLIGLASDRTRTRWGRRHPFMYAAALPAAISFILLWNPPDGLSHGALVVWLVVLLLSVRFFTSLYEVPSAALAPELAPDYHDRTVVLSYRWLFQTLGTAAALSLAYGWFLRKTPDYPVGQMNPEGYGPLSYAVAAMMVVSILVSTLGTHSRIKSLHQPAARKLDIAATARELVTTLKNRNLGVAVLAGVIYGMSTGLYSGLAIYLATFFWGLPASNVLALTLAAVVSSPIAATVGPALSRLWGKRRACMTLFFTGVVITGAPILLRLIGFFPENGHLTTIDIGSWQTTFKTIVPVLTIDRILGGICSTGGFIVVTSMIADITDESQVKTGRRSEGLLLSADSILTKTASALSAFIPGLLLTAIAFPVKAKPGQVPHEILQQLGWVYLIATVTLSSLSILTWRLYRIDQASHEQNLATIRDAMASAEKQAEANA